MKALKALDKVGILDKAYTRYDQLSGSTTKGCSCKNFKSKSFDNTCGWTCSSLDPIMADVVMDDFKRINKEMNITIIINIHHVDLALKYANRVIGIRSGEIVYDGKSEDVNQDVLDKIYAGKEVPEMVKEVVYG